MIDINLIRNDDTRKLVINSEMKRFRSGNNVIEVYNLDKEKNSILFEIEQNNKKLNSLQKKITQFFKSKKKANITEKMENLNLEKEESVKFLEKEKTDLLKKNKSLKSKYDEIQKEWLSKLKSIGNILDERVIISKSEDDNKLIRSFDSDRKIKPKFSHFDLMKKVDGLDSQRGAKIFGHRGYFLMNDLALLELSLSRYAVDFCLERNYKLLQTPVLLLKDIMAATAQLSNFDEQLYPVGDNHYLIATSEQTASSFHMNERLLQNDLPFLYVCDSLCFRKEAGAHGKDNLGIFRTHQFHKIEQFVICSPESSNNWFNKMVETSEEFLKSLEISFRTVSIVSGEMNDAAGIKYDIEAYFPKEDRYRELVSVSNCTDFQSRDLEVRYGLAKEKNEKRYVHMLNGTLSAIQRTLCCLVENYQTENGIKIPKVLKKYIGKDFIPFIDKD